MYHSVILFRSSSSRHTWRRGGHSCLLRGGRRQLRTRSSSAEDRCKMPQVQPLTRCFFKLPLYKCLWRIGAWMQALDNTAASKVGIAFNPAHRWRNDDFGYVHEQMWMFMDVMHSGSADECRSLEKDLIRSVGRLPGCYNASPGGEGVCSTTPGACHCYAVYAPAGSGVGVHAAWRQRANTSRGSVRQVVVCQREHA